MAALPHLDLRYFKLAILIFVQLPEYITHCCLRCVAEGYMFCAAVMHIVLVGGIIYTGASDVLHLSTSAIAHHRCTHPINCFYSEL